MLSDATVLLLFFSPPILLFAFQAAREFSIPADRRNGGFRFRLLAVAGGAALLAEDLLTAPLSDWTGWAAEVGLTGLLLLSAPCSFEKVRHPYHFPALLLGGNAAWRLAAPALLPADGLPAPVFALVASLLCCYFVLACRTVRRNASVRALFHARAPLRHLEEAEQLLLSVLLAGITCGYLLCLPARDTLSTVLAAVFSLLFLFFEGVLYRCFFTRHLALVGPERERRIREMAEGNLRQVCTGPEAEEQRMQALYRRIQVYMEEQRPYLDAEFDMTEMSKVLFTNKLYLSRTINLLSGRNFRQFINYYRIQYATGLLKENPRRKLVDVSEKSGFHSVVSFNMAFKVNTGQTPSEWVRDYMASRLSER
ncbi:MAG: AraC family transcriptional regulator [Bacteroidales bacterium]|nr:AraC family transcriptional regulator [Bacteroidales bacterium]